MSIAAPPLVIPRRSRRRWYLVAALLLFILPPVAAYYITGWLRQRELDALYREIEASDPNWRWPDLIANLPPPPPDEENAALQVLKVRESLSPTRWARGMIANNIHNQPNARLTEEQAKAIQAELAKLDPSVLVEARKLANMPKGRFLLDPDPMEGRDSHELPRNTLGVMSFLRDDAALLCHDDAIEEAGKSCQAMMHVTRVLHDYPALMGQLFHSAAQERAVISIEHTLGQGQLSAAQLQELQTVLELEADVNNVYQAFRGERAFANALVVNIIEGKSEYPGLANLSGTDRLYFFFPSLYLGDYLADLRFQTERVEASKLRDAEQVQAIGAVNRKLPTKPTSVLQRTAIQTQGFVEEIRPIEARVRCAAVGIAAERFRLENGTWPKGADDLVKAGLLKEPLKDLYDGKPLRWKHTATGLIIYSVGADLTDDGGKLARHGGRAPTGLDIGFELWSPQHRAVPPPTKK